MQVVCSNCQLSFQAPDGATGLVCPICRNPLRAPEGSGPVDTAPSKQVLDWAGGTLDDLVALLSAPAWSARIEVMPAGGNPVGEVQVIAGGVSDAIFEGKSTHESLDKLRAVANAKFRIEPRLPNPANGDLAAPGPDHGKLEERPLATLMRYCEEFVLTAGIEVWRASENAKVEYKRGEIVGVTVGGIDAPERLAEVMKWSSGSYRLLVPRLSIPDKAPKAAAPPAVVAPRTMGAASKTIFGMPALDPAAIAAAADKARQAKSGSAPASAPGVTPAAVPPPAVPPPSAPSIAAAPSAGVPPARPGASGRSTTVGQAVAPTPPAPVAPPAPQAQPAIRASTNRTIFGVAAPPQTPATAVPAPTPPPATARPSSPAMAAPPAPAPAAPPAAVHPPATPAGSGAAARPTTAVSIPAVAAPPPATTRTTSPAATPAPASTAIAKATEKAPAKKQKEKAQPPATTSEETTQPTKAKPKSKGTPVWTYVGVGFVFGLALLGVYRLVMVLAH